MVWKKSINKLDEWAVVSSSKLNKTSSALIKLFLKDWKLDKKNLWIFLWLFILVSVWAVTIPWLFEKKAEFSPVQNVELEPEKIVIKPKSNWLKYRIHKDWWSFFSQNLIKLWSVSKIFISHVKKVDSIFSNNNLYQTWSRDILSEDYQQNYTILTEIYNKLVKIDQISFYLIDKTVSYWYIFEDTQVVEIIWELESMAPDLDKFLEHSKIFIYENKWFPNKVIPLITEFNDYLWSISFMLWWVNNPQFSLLKWKIKSELSNYKNIDGYILDETKFLWDIDYLIQYVESFNISDDKKREIIWKLNEFRIEFSKISQIKDDSFDLEGAWKHIIERLDDIIYKISI